MQAHAQQDGAGSRRCAGPQPRALRFSAGVSLPAKAASTSCCRSCGHVAVRLHAPASRGPSRCQAKSSDQEARSAQYTQQMNAKMQSSLTYRHELGINYHRIAPECPDIIVGSCLQTPGDVDRLVAEENIKVVYCLQEDSDLRYWRVDLKAIQRRCRELGVNHCRFPIRDFDGQDLRRKLPDAIARLAKEHNPAAGTAYIHCTAGLGRAPATAVAYMAWVRGIPVDDAMAQVRIVRPCNPRVEAVRAATADLVLGCEKVTSTIAVRSDAASSVKVAGLDHGWDTHVDMDWDAVSQRWLVSRQLNPGTYRFKLVVDGTWRHSTDHPTVRDGVHINNELVVLAERHPELSERHQRLAAPGVVLTPEELRLLRRSLLKGAQLADEEVALGYALLDQQQAADKPLCTIM